MKQHRVVITAMGCLMPNGNSPEEFGDALVAGRSGAGPITTFDASGLPTTIAAEVKWDGPWTGDRKMTFAVEAARQAWERATACGSEPRGGGRVSLGVGLEIFDVAKWAEMKLPDFVLPETLADRLMTLHMPADLSAHKLSHIYGLQAAPRVMISTCAAGADAIGAAYHDVAGGRQRWAMAGGTDSEVNPIGITAFSKLCTLSTQNEEPEKAPKPFSRDRDGFVMGEGAGIVILERLEDARERGAPILAEVAGFGSSLDAFGITEPHPEGRGAVQAMERAMADAGIGPDEVDAINAHATGTRLNDPVETKAIKTVFGERAGKIPIQATKSMIGHLICAAGAAEAIATIECLRRNKVHPTLNLHDPDEACDLDYVPLVARDHPTRVAMCNSFGFGGMNASLIFRKVED
ncbi:MAG: beta-ketoacyl-[acyl-carrier-protein] synthase family protein [Planctomycetota bacterium]|nr:MAG: beta-ketoacyl-[acyl-carrier-protein] synthase family protein [Planctomycetota bacterium]